ncbi:MAG: type II toxin-antitoxin system RelE/ParE family toxin [Mariprofundaceae bacterium]
MAEIIWTESALVDLDSIAEYIALDKLNAAQQLIEKVFSRVELLQQSPDSGRKPPEFTTFRYKEVIVGPCRIFYRFTENKIYILYVMRSERKLRNYILSDRESEHH